MKLKDFSKQKYTDYDLVAIARSEKHYRGSIEKELRHFIRKFKKQARLKLAELELDMGPELTAGPSYKADSQEYEFRKQYLEDLKLDKAIENFTVSYKTFGKGFHETDRLVANIKLVPEELSKFFSSQKLLKKPHFFIKDNQAWLQFNEKLTVSIGGVNTKPVILFRELYSVSNHIKSVDSIVDALMTDIGGGVDRKKSSFNPTLDNKIKRIESARGDLLRILKKAGVGRRVKIKIDKGPPPRVSM